MSSPLDRLVVFIMAGGSGERFWPVSRNATPKHLVKLLGDQTLLEQTAKRFEGLIPNERIFILTNRAQLEATLAAVPFLPKGNIIAEPAKRDTAPAAALATAIASTTIPDAIVALFPADHMIHDGTTFQRQLSEAAQRAATDPAIVTFSITPTHASSGFGYLELGEQFVTSDPSSSRFVRVNRFVEKPHLDRALEFVSGGRHGWNAGMFLWQAATFLAECDRQQPQLSAFIRNFPDRPDAIGSYLDATFPNLPKISVDFAVMEQALNVVALIAEFDWDDVGSWSALPDHLGKDGNNNTLQGKVITLNAGRNIVVAGKRTIALCGVSDLVVVETEDAILICHRNADQQIKNLPLPPELK